VSGRLDNGRVIRKQKSKTKTAGAGETAADNQQKYVRFEDGI